MKNTQDIGFLQGGGEMGELVRNYSWQNTDIGLPESWPLSLQTTVGIILHSAFPMFLFWGKSLLCFYNDAFRPSLGKSGKHPLIGKGGKEAWPDTWHFIGPLIEKVMTTGEAVWFEDQFLPIYRNGKIEDVYWTFSYSPAYGDKGTIEGVFVTCTETTSKVIASQELRNGQMELLSYFEQSPVAIATLSKEHLTFRLANSVYCELVGRKSEEILDKPLLEALPELKGQGFDTILQEVIRTGVPFIAGEIAAELKRKGALETVYVNVTYQPQRGSGGDITGIWAVATDVTQQVQSRKKAEESGARLRTMIQQTPTPTLVLIGKDLVVEQINAPMLQMIGQDESVIGLPLITAMPELEGQYIWEQVKKVYKDGISFDQSEVLVPHMRKGVLQDHYYNLSYRPLKENGIIMGMIQVAIDVTEQVLARQKIEESEARFRNLLQEAPVAATLFRGPELIVEVANDLTLKYWRKNKNIIGKPLSEAAPELEDKQMIALIKGVYESGGMVSYAETPIRFIENGHSKDGFYSFSLKALYNSKGEVESVLSTGIDVTEQVIVRRQIEQKEKELRDLISIAPLGICVVSGMEARIEEVNERFILISGKKPEQFINATYWSVFPEVAETFSPVLENVFKSGEKFSIDEIELTLIRHGVPEKIFVTFDYIPIRDNSGEVSKIIVLVIDVSHQVEIRKKIEEAVVDRTKELADLNKVLQRSNKELEQFAYIASHDLQEPIRKISTFTQLLEHSINNISDKSKSYIDKIYNSTDRMTNLIRDVLAYSQIDEDVNEFEKVDLNKTLDAVRTDYEVQIENTQATIEISRLPTIDAIPSQMIQLFDNLMSNALKYRRQEVKPIIKISCSLADDDQVAKRMSLDRNKKYFHIEFRDNGIGFHKDHVDRIFRIFQRLHTKTEFEGTGIGLAICLKIIQKHQGHISAAADENGGAVFNILLPRGN